MRIADGTAFLILFATLFRMYLPDIEVLNGQYKLPGIVHVK